MTLPVPHPPENDRPVVPPSHPIHPAHPVKHHRIRWSFLSVGAVVLIVLVVGGWLAVRAISVINTKKLNDANKRVGFFSQLTHLVTAGDRPIDGEQNDRINVLVLGIGGPGHDGPYLTDTMLVASYKPSTDQLALISIPRDLVVDIPGYDYRKINNVLAFGRDMKYPGGGEALTVKIVSDLLDIPIHYYTLIDFQGFVDVIDRVNGVDVTVDTAFTDYEYPDENYGYQTIRFKAGAQEMNGATALKFARSRHGNNGEGSDFARARRQQIIIEALKQKFLSIGTLTNPKKISDILGSLGKHSQTNMEIWEMLRFAKLAGKIPHDRIINEVLDSSANGFLQNATGAGGAFILIPKDRTYADIRYLAKNVFLIAMVRADHAAVGVINASGSADLAEKDAQSLRAFGLAATALPGTLATQTNTAIVERTPGQLVPTAFYLKRYHLTKNISALSAWLPGQTNTALIEAVNRGASETKPGLVNTNAGVKNLNVTTTRPYDFLIILGTDHVQQARPVIPAFKNGWTNSANTNAAANKNTNSTNKNTNRQGNANTNGKTNANNTNSAAKTNVNSAKIGNKNLNVNAALENTNGSL